MKNKLVTKIIKIADLEKFEVYAYAPCYRYAIVVEPDYFVDLDTQTNIGQELKLAILPDGTPEPMHYGKFIKAGNQVVPLTEEDIPLTPYGKELLKNNC